MANDNFYPIWSGSLNLGDTPGVFNNAQFCGLLLHIPIKITFLPDTDAAIEFRLRTTDVEIYNDAKHPVYWNWSPGTAFSSPVGYIDDTDGTPSVREYHTLQVPISDASVGNHTITIVVNSDVALGMKDDFVLEQIDAANTIGAKLGA